VKTLSVLKEIVDFMSNKDGFDDKVFLERALRFDRDALAAIYDFYHPLIYKYILNRVDEPEIARDLTGELFKRFLQTLQRSQVITNLRAWLFRAAHNLVIDHYRRREHRRHLQLNETLPAAGPEPAIIAAAHLQADAVRKAISQLTPDQQQVITLKFLVGFSNQETADILQKPVGAVKSLQHRALASLQRQLLPVQEKAKI
jgi:RNA polymerase sigma-70 factor (ECF subfamily)